MNIFSIVIEFTAFDWRIVLAIVLGIPLAILIIVTCIISQEFLKGIMFLVASVAIYQSFSLIDSFEYGNVMMFTVIFCCTVLVGFSLKLMIEGIVKVIKNDIKEQV